MKNFVFNENIQRELLSFVTIGLLATLTDFMLYYFLQLILTYSIAKILSFLTGSLVAFFLNKFLTFKRKEKSSAEIFRFISLYGSTLIINVGVNSFCIYLLSAFFKKQEAIVLSFLIATSVSTVINFLGQKFWVFSNSSSYEKTLPDYGFQK